MTFVNTALSVSRRSCDAFPDHLSGRGVETRELHAQREAQNFAAEVDRNSIWPTHRIRSFLLSQHYNEPRAETR